MAATDSSGVSQPTAFNLEASSRTLAELAVDRLRAREWRSSVECQCLIQVLLHLRATEFYGRSQLITALAQNVPSFFMPGSDEAFFTALHQEALSDADLRESIVDFLAGWSHMHRATYDNILADLAVKRPANAILPEYIPLWLWMENRLREAVELREDAGSWTIHLNSDSDLAREVVHRFTS